MMIQKKKLLVTTVFIILFLNIFATIFILYSVDQKMSVLTGRISSGEMSLCINNPPKLVIPCNTTMSQNSSYFCQLIYSDPDFNTNFTFLQVPFNRQIFDIDRNGIINFTPVNNQTGNWSTVIILNDNSGCSNSEVNQTFNFTIKNINDPPYLVSPIPNIGIAVNTTYHAFFLNDYFTDPDGDLLTYNVTIPAIGVNLRLLSSSEVIVSADNCVNKTTVQFSATDPYNLSADSNLVEIEISCENNNGGSQGGDDSGSGGGGGGGASSSCISEWNCLDWLTCLPTGFQWRHCYDMQGCEDPKFLKRECNYTGKQPTCEENWQCSDWGVCLINNTQYRTCEDLNNCNTEFYKPFLTQPCIYKPTCNDGIQNGNETGVDCGGDCVACSLTENPSFIKTKSFSIWLLGIILLSILFIGGVMKLYHEELLKMLSNIMLRFSKHKNKELLLNNTQKSELLQRLLSAELLVEKDIDNKDSLKLSSYLLLTKLSRKYFTMIFNMPFEFRKDELIEVIRKKNISTELSTILIGFFTTIYSLEASNIDFDEVFFFNISEELRTLICLTSDYNIVEIERSLKDFVIKNNDSITLQILKRSIYFYRELQFQQIELAKNEYIKILSLYEDSSDKDDFYSIIELIFEELRYAIERS